MDPINIINKLSEREKEEAMNKLVGTPNAARTVGPPRIESVSLMNSSKYELGLGGHIEVMVMLSERVAVTEQTELKIQFHPAKTKNAKYESGSGTKRLLFRYTVEEKDQSQGVSIPDGEINIKSATDENLTLHYSSVPLPNPPLRVTDKFDEVVVIGAINRLRTSHFATLVVEGTSDQDIYSWFEDLLGTPKHIPKLDVGGRNNLLEIYTRREEFASQVAVAFMADPDREVLDDRDRILSAYPDIIWTTGYSIENDLYTDGKPTSLIHPNDLTEYNQALQTAINDFAQQVVDEVNYKYVVKDRSKLKEEYHAAISTNASLKLRGKNLFEVLEKFCTTSAHKRLSSKPELRLVRRVIDTVGDHRPLITRLLWKIRNELDKQESELFDTHHRTLRSMRVPSNL